MEATTSTTKSAAAVDRLLAERLTSGDDNVDIANPGQAGEAGTMRIGTQGQQTRAFLQGVSGTAISGSTQRVIINPNGQPGTAKASRPRRSRSAPPPVSACSPR